MLLESQPQELEFRVVIFFAWYYKNITCSGWDTSSQTLGREGLLGSSILECKFPGVTILLS